MGNGCVTKTITTYKDNVKYNTGAQKSFMDMAHTRLKVA
jgi:hypothetical protein